MNEEERDVDVIEEQTLREVISEEVSKACKETITEYFDTHPQKKGLTIKDCICIGGSVFAGVVAAYGGRALVKLIFHV